MRRIEFAGGALVALIVAVTSAAPAVAYWKPKPTTDPWQIQLQGKIKTNVAASAFDFDGLDNSANVVRKVKRGGGHAICYFSAGTYEPFRADAERFPQSIRGKPVKGFEEERWLDIRRLDLIGPVLLERMRTCKQKGFDAVDPDNVDGYSNDTGFPLTAAHQLAFNRWLAARAHEMDLAIGLKNDLEQVPDLVKSFDFAINEQCFAFDECRLLRPFIRAKKPVYGIEYEVPPSKFCKESTKLGFSTIFKTVALKAPRTTC